MSGNNHFQQAENFMVIAYQRVLFTLTDQLYSGFLKNVYHALKYVSKYSAFYILLLFGPRTKYFLASLFCKENTQTNYNSHLFLYFKNVPPQNTQAPFCQIKAPKETLFPRELACKRYALYLSLYIYSRYLVRRPNTFS